MTSAQFSNQFALAIAAVWGRCDFRAFQKAMAFGVPDPEISTFAKRVEVTLDPEAEAAFPNKLVARVTVLDKSGGKHSAFAEATGSGSTPLSADVVIEKFRSGAGIHLSADRVDQLVSAVLDIENLHSIAEITDLAVSNRR
jgi:2-methylcitrate dehydratase PrpD